MMDLIKDMLFSNAIIMNRTYVEGYPSVIQLVEYAVRYTLKGLFTHFKDNKPQNLIKRHLDRKSLYKTLLTLFQRKK